MEKKINNKGILSVNILMVLILCMLFCISHRVQAQSFARIKNLAESGNVQAQFVLGNMYANGNGCLQDNQKAIYWYKKSIEGGNQRALPSLALLYDNLQEYEKAYPLFLSFASSDESKIGDYIDMLAISMIKVGEYKLEGKGTSEDDVLAVTWLKKALDIDWNGFAHTMLGYCYLKGEGVEKDSLRAFNNFVIATEKYNHESAKIALATCYVEGIGCKADYTKVYRLLDDVKENGRGIIQLLLGIAYYKDTSISDHYTKAVLWLQHATDNKDKKDAAAAMYWLSKCYRFGRGVRKDLNKAAELVDKAAKEGDEKALSLSNLIQRNRY